MKKILTYLFSFLLVTVVTAQSRKVNYLTTFDDKLVHFGFSLGVNTLDFDVANYATMGENLDFIPKDPIGTEDMIRADVASLVPGFTVGIVSSLRLSQDFNLRFLPGMSFGERKLTYNIPVEDINSYESSDTYSLKSTFLDFPLLLKYKARRINNGRPYIIAGSAYRIDISRTAKEDLVKLKSNGFYAEVGAGWDHYYPFFRFSVEAKFSFGLTDQLGNVPAETQRQYYAQSIRSLRSNIFTLLFHFE